jgi:hypothetical protein
MLEGRVAGGLAARLAEVLTAGELAELAALIGPGEREHVTCAEVTRVLVGEALERGRSEGWLRCMGEHKAAQQGLVADLRLERRRWRQVCGPCRRLPTPREHCRDCRDGTRAAFGRAEPGGYAGGPVPAW